MLNAIGIRPNYKVVRNFDATGDLDTIAFHSRRYEMVTLAIQLLKKGEKYGSGQNEICIIRLKDGEYVYDEKGEQNVYERPGVRAKKPGENKRLPNTELIKNLRSHAEISIALAGMEKTGDLDGNEAAIQEYLRATMTVLQMLDGIDRKMLTQAVNEYFPKVTESVPAQ